MSAVPPLRQAMLRGSAWMFAMRQITNLIGFVSTIILARLLTPEDFGIVAMALLVVALGEVLLDFGVDAAVIQKDEPTREFTDTAWTMRVLQFAGVALFTFLAAPLAADLFEEPKLTVPLQILGATTAILGLQNIGIVLLRKELQFRKDFVLMVSRRIVSFAATVILAFVLGTYWAIIWSTVILRVFMLIQSYMIHEYRPRFSLQCIRELWGFSQWMLLRALGNYAQKRGDVFVAALTGSTGLVGGFMLAKQASNLPGQSFVAPLERALFPGFSKLQNDMSRFRAAYVRVLTVVSALALPMTVGVALVADEAIVVLFGDKWLFIAEYLRPLALAAALHCIYQTASLCLVSLGKVKLVAFTVWCEVAVFLAVAIPAGMVLGLLGVALAKVVAAAVRAGWVWTLAARAMGLARVDFSRAMFRAILAVAVMSAAVSWTPAVCGAISTLAIKVSVGAVSYTLASLLMWWLQGRPEGLESLVLAHARDALRRLARGLGGESHPK